MHVIALEFGLHIGEYQRIFGACLRFEGAARRPLGDRAPQSLPDRVRGRLAEALGDGDTSLHGVARSLGMSTRTLQRRLRESGGSYDGLVDDVRRGLSMWCLDAGDRSVDEIAALLGFPDPSALHGDFRRWTLATPRSHLPRGC